MINDNEKHLKDIDFQSRLHLVVVWYSMTLIVACSLLMNYSDLFLTLILRARGSVKDRRSRPGARPYERVALKAYQVFIFLYYSHLSYSGFSYLDAMKWEHLQCDERPAMSQSKTVTELARPEHEAPFYVLFGIGSSMLILKLY